MKRSITVCLTIALLLCVGSTAQAALRVYEGFNYWVPQEGEFTNVGPGVGLECLGDNGTTIGLNETYTSSGYAMGVIYQYGASHTAPNPGDPGYTTSIQYPASVNATSAMTPIGNHYYTGYYLQGHEANLTPAATYDETIEGAGTVYTAYLMNKWRDNYFGTLAVTTNVQYGFGGAGQWWSLSAPGTVTYPGGSGEGPNGETRAPNHVPTWLVTEITYDGLTGTGGDQVRMWINPDASLPIALQSPYAVATGGDVTPVDRIGSLGWGRDARYDEIRYADTWSDLVNSNPGDQGVPTTTVDGSTDPRSGVGYDLRLEATADASRGNENTHTYYTYLLHNVGEQDGLIRFDLDDVAEAQGKTIVEAKIVLTGWHLFDNDTLHINAYQITEDWDDDPNTAAGADPNTATTVIAVHPDAYNGLIELDVTALAQQWVDGTAPDYGISVGMYDANEVRNTSRRAFISRHQMPIIPDGTWEDPNDVSTYADYGHGYYGIERPVLVVKFGESAIPGDANEDGIVDGQDFTILKAYFGQSGMSWSNGDFNGDGLVDGQDFTILKAHFGEGTPPVPEPATMSLIALGGLALLRKRR